MTRLALETAQQMCCVLSINDLLGIKAERCGLGLVRFCEDITSKVALGAAIARRVMSSSSPYPTIPIAAEAT